jgi:formylglycine-generating enzyme required for sulfatase activity
VNSIKHLLTVGVFTALASCGNADAEEAKARPNVILVMTDDQGYGDLSCHGNPILKTPSLDRLHGESVRFTDFHVSPFCTPTRAAQWMAGQFEIPIETRDRHGNPIRQGGDAESGLPSEIRHKQSGIHFVFIPAGNFIMGTDSPDAFRPDESTPHKVTLSRPYYIAKYEVTNREWENMSLKRHHRFSGEGFPDIPVRGHYYNTYILYCDLLCMNLPAGSIRLSTEAQWEYACRAGTQKRYLTSNDPSALDEISWHRGNSRSKLHSVGQKKPNAWGVYDMLGNAFEFVLDRYRPYTREEVTDPNLFSFRGMLTKRGGNSRSTLNEIGAGTRTMHKGSARGDWLGFRPVLNLPVNHSPLPQGISGTFTKLLTAGDQAHWVHTGTGGFEIKNGQYVAIEPDARALTVFTGKRYADFILRLEYHFEGSKTNGGVAVRFPREKAGLSTDTTEGFEIEIYGNQTGWIRPANRMKINSIPLPGWNLLEIYCLKTEIFSRLNGKLIAQASTQRKLEGLVGIQQLKGKLRVRNLEILKIKGKLGDSIQQLGAEAREQLQQKEN